MQGDEFPANIVLGNSGERGHKKPGLLVTPALSLSYCALLPDEPAGQEAAAYQHRARAQREQRRRAATARRRQCLLLLLRSGSRGWGGSRGWSGGRGSLRRRGRRRGSGLGRLGLTRGLGNNSSGLRLYNPILTLGLSLRPSGTRNLGLGVGNDGRLVLGQGGRGGQQSHRHHHSRQQHQLPQSNLPPLAREPVLMPEADPLRRIRLQKSCHSSTTLPLRLAGSRRGLVDLLVARRGRLRAYRDRRADLLELELVRGGTVLEDVGQVLGVAGVANTLYARTLGRVVTSARDLEGLIKLAALAFLLGLLAYLGYGRDGGQGQHRQQRRQHH